MTSKAKYLKSLRPCHQCLRKDGLDLLVPRVYNYQYILICHYCDFDIRSTHSNKECAQIALKGKWNAIWKAKTTKLQQYLHGEDSDTI
jgi:hypothetical protein